GYSANSWFSSLCSRYQYATSVHRSCVFIVYGPWPLTGFAAANCPNPRLMLHAPGQKRPRSSSRHSPWGPVSVSPTLMVPLREQQP
ncbi:hypothetical protein, partial [Providencia sp. Je.9.19]|uniref:hypothetical protein n=1 Tax=Providencia sp. Je.9.19 TaxID=3142844 RepID=UPI003DAA3CB3